PRAAARPSDWGVEGGAEREEANARFASAPRAAERLQKPGQEGRAHHAALLAERVLDRDARRRCLQAPEIGRVDEGVRQRFGETEPLRHVEHAALELARAARVLRRRIREP